MSPQPATTPGLNWLKNFYPSCRSAGGIEKFQQKCLLIRPIEIFYDQRFGRASAFLLKFFYTSTTALGTGVFEEILYSITALSAHVFDPELNVLLI